MNASIGRGEDEGEGRSNPWLEGLGSRIDTLLQDSGQPLDSWGKYSHRLQVFLYFLFLFGGLSWIIRLCLQSEGVINQDEIGHLLIARNGWFHPSFLLDEWGRFVNTLFYFIPSAFGLTGSRVFSVIISFLTVIVTTQIARFFKIKYYFLIPIFLWFQPFFGAYAFSILTEVPLSFVLALAVLFTLKEKHGAGAFCIGLLPLIRHEAILLTGLWCLYYLYMKKPKYILVSVAPLIFYIVLYYLVHHEFVYQIFFQPKPTSFYGTGEWTHFFKYLPDWAGTALLFLVVPGLFEVMRYGKRALIFLGGYLLYYLTHIVLWKFALYSTGGYYIVLIPVAPAFAILASLGIKLLMRAAQQLVPAYGLRPIKLLAFALTIPFVIAHGVSMAAPYGADEEQLLMEQVARSVEDMQPAPERVISTHVWFYYYYFYDRPWTEEEFWIAPPQSENIPPGAVVIWDAHFSERFGLPLQDLTDPRNSFRKIMADRSGTVVVFYKPAGTPRR